MTDTDTDTNLGEGTGAPAAAGRHPVYYWNRRSLDLVALDHSIPAADARAPGPCASSRALGIIHAAVADAVAHAYPAPFAAHFNPASPGPIGDIPPLFVGGAAYAVMKSIYDGPVFAQVVLDGARDEFMGLHPGTARQKRASWDAGVRFGGAAAFTRLWDAATVQALLRSDPAAYVPPPERAHRPDPWNPAQGFYGQRWGSIQPLVLDGDDVAGIARNELKAAPPIDGDELDLLIAKGSRTARDAGESKARTRRELYVGLFWAYDGARLLGTPPVLYNRAVERVARADELDIPGVARLFALSNLAMADSAVVAWEAKWRIALWRPVVAIQALTAEKKWQPYGAPRSDRGRFLSAQAVSSSARAAGEDLAASRGVVEDASAAEAQDTAAALLGASPAASPSPPDPEYARAAFTPNFPSYPSGHATFGGACFNSLLLARSERGRKAPNNVEITLTSGELDGVTTDNYAPSRRRDDVPMEFRHLVQPEPAGVRFAPDAFTGGNDASRIFLGVHWSFDQRDGDVAGRKVGRIVHSRAYGPK